MTDSSQSWSPDFRLLSLDDQMMEIVDHVRRLRAEVATLRAEINASREPDSTLPPYFRDRGDMTKPR